MGFANTKKGFSRKYFIFANEDAGYETGREPSGYVKLEVREGKGMLHSVVHNIKPGNGVFDYVLYLIRTCLDRQPAIEIRAGTYNTEGGKAELEWSFDPSSVGKSGHEIDKFDVFAVIVEYADKRRQDKQGEHKTARGVICPLVAYVNGPTNWRKNSFGAGGQCARPERQDEFEGAQDFHREQDTSREQFNIPGGTGDTGQKQHIAQQKMPAGGQQGDKTENGLNKGDPGCAYFNDNLCNAFVNNTAGNDPCGSCMFRNREKAAEAQSLADIARLKSELEKCFETSDPFHSARSDYTWWKVTDPVNLNNILYRNGIRTPLMLNPAVMMSYYRYRHLIIGIFVHRTGQNFIVCGVPGMHMVDGKPFGELSKWVQVGSGKQRYGAPGYWLAYIDPSDGKILEI